MTAIRPSASHRSLIWKGTIEAGTWTEGVACFHNLSRASRDSKRLLRGDQDGDCCSEAQRLWDPSQKQAAELSGKACAFDAKISSIED